MADYDVDLSKLKRAINGLKCLDSMVESQVLVGFLFQTKDGDYKFFNMDELLTDLEDSLNMLESYGKEDYNKLED